MQTFHWKPCNYTIVPGVAARVTIIFAPMTADRLKKHKIGMHFNQAYETVTRGRPTTEVNTEPCPAYGVVVHTHH